MNHTIEAPFTLRDSDRTAIEEKLETLNSYDNKITQINVFFKLGDGKENDVLAEIRVRVPGKDVFAESGNPLMMVAFNEAYTACKKQLLKRKDKQNNHQSDIKDLNDIVNMNF